MWVLTRFSKWGVRTTGYRGHFSDFLGTAWAIPETLQAHVRHNCQQNCGKRFISYIW